MVCFSTGEKTNSPICIKSLNLFGYFFQQTHDEADLIQTRNQQVKVRLVDYKEMKIEEAIADFKVIDWLDVRIVSIIDNVYFQIRIR